MFNKPMLQITLIVVVVITVAFIIVVALRPDDFRVTRSTIIAAPPAAVFSHVNELKKWASSTISVESVARHPEFPGNEVEHGQQVLGGWTAPGFALGG